MPRLITAAQYKSNQRQLAQSAKDKARIRRQSLAAIAAAKAAGHVGRLILAREDAFGMGQLVPQVQRGAA